MNRCRNQEIRNLEADALWDEEEHCCTVALEQLIKQVKSNCCPLSNVKCMVPCKLVKQHPGRKKHVKWHPQVLHFLKTNVFILYFPWNFNECILSSLYRVTGLVLLQSSPNCYWTIRIIVTGLCFPHTGLHHFCHFLWCCFHPFPSPRKRQV